MHRSIGRRIGISIVMIMCGAALTFGQDTPAPAPPAPEAEKEAVPQGPPETTARVDQIRIRGLIEGENISFTLDFTAVTTKPNQRVQLITGEAVLDEVLSPEAGYRLEYLRDHRMYIMTFPRQGRHEVQARFAVRAQSIESGRWRQVSFDVPTSRVRQIEVQADRTDLEVKFPHAMRVQRDVRNDTLTLSAVMGSAQPFIVQWQPHVEKLDAKLVMSVTSNTVAMARIGSLVVDTVYDYQIAQGGVRELRLSLPRELSVTEVRGLDIQEWRVDGQELVVTLSREQTQRYGLQVTAKRTLGAFPLEDIKLPVIEPVGGIRAGGHVMVGTDSAIQLVISRAAGLSQIDTSVFPRVQLDRANARPIPRGKTFSYSHATREYDLALALDEVMPSFSAEFPAVVLTMSEGDLTLEAMIDLEIRDAPVRSVTLIVPAGLVLARVVGEGVIGEHEIRGGPGSETHKIEVRFAQPVLGRRLLRVQMDLGHGPLGDVHRIRGLGVMGAQHQRGYVAVVARRGVRLDAPTTEKLVKVPAGSLPVSVRGAQYAYRFTAPEEGVDWAIALSAQRRDPAIRAEAFDMPTLTDHGVIGAAVVSYFITGSPVDQLSFIVPDSYREIDFIGAGELQATRDSQNPNRWVVKLPRKVMGDFNLGVAYRQPYSGSKQFTVGGLRCDDVQTQTGYVVIGSHLNLKLSDTPKSGDAMHEVQQQDIPDNYRLLPSAPVLRVYRYATSPEPMTLGLDMFQREEMLPVVIELADLDSDLRVGEEGRIEAVTQVVYEIKNASSQFLELTLPAGTPWWSTFIEDAGGRRVPVKPSYDKQSGRLMVPLERGRNPDRPITVVLQYGQTYDAATTIDRIRLTAPQTGQAASFANWTVKVEDGSYAIRKVGGGMTPDARRLSEGGITPVFDRVSDAWARGMAETFDTTGAWILLAALVMIALALLVPLAILGRGAWVDVLVAVLLTAGLVFGCGAWLNSSLDGGWRAGGEHIISFTRPVASEAEQAMSVEIGLAPVWRQHATVLGAVIIPIVALLATVAGVFLRKLRPLLIALGVAGLAYGAAQFEPGQIVLAHLLTWGIWAILFAWFIIHNVLRRLLRVATGRGEREGRSPSGLGGMKPVATMIGLLAMANAGLIINGCAATQDIEAALPVAQAHVMDRLRCDLAAERDSMTLQMQLTLAAKEKTIVPLITADAVLLTEGDPDANVRVIEEGGQHQLELLKPGRYELDLRFLLPLAEAGEDGARRFRLETPTALSNRVVLSLPQTELTVEAPSAVRRSVEEAGEATGVELMFAPGAPIEVSWRPRARERELEETVCYGDLTSVARVDTGVVQTRHLVHLQVSKGQLDRLRIRTPQDATVTQVRGAELGAWRFDPAAREIDLRFTKPIVGDYWLMVVTQQSKEGLPYEVSLGTLDLVGVKRLEATMGVVTSPAVFVDVSQGGQATNVDDFAREAKPVLDLFARQPISPVRHAFQMARAEDTVTMRVGEVQPELSAQQRSEFQVFDDRLVFASNLDVEITKAGVFAVKLRIPQGYDIDALSAVRYEANEERKVQAVPADSHWDEREEAGQRIVQVHLKRKVQGMLTLRVSLSRTLGDLPRELEAPRIELVGAHKQKGLMVIAADKGVQLSVSERAFTVEDDPLEYNLSPQLRERQAMVFRLLRPQWRLKLRTRVLEPRITTQFLHVATVTDGLVRHKHYLRYRMQNVGSKLFEFEPPGDAIGLIVTGSNIATAERQGEDGNRWRVELREKEYEGDYLLTISYEREFDRTKEQFTLEPVKAIGAIRESGHVAILADERMAIDAPGNVTGLRLVDARTLPTGFGAGELSSAPLCFEANTTDFALPVAAELLGTAQSQGADVESVDITTVVDADGRTMNEVAMKLSVSGKRLLRTQLPDGAEVWSLRLNGRAAALSVEKQGGKETLLIPLAQSQLPVYVEFVYVTPPADTWQREQQVYHGPRFELPLKNVTWRMFLPADYAYSDFAGTMGPLADAAGQRAAVEFNREAYRRKVQTRQIEAEQNVNALLRVSNQANERGQQYRARQALETATNYATDYPVLSEDARTKLHELVEQQTMVGLVGNRDRLRLQTGAYESNPYKNLGDQFRGADADNLLKGLLRDDKQNLQSIVRRISRVQEAAAPRYVQLAVAVPEHGKQLVFTRSLQVAPDAKMAVEFAAAPLHEPGRRRDALSGVVMAVALVILFALLTFALRRWGRLRAALTRSDMQTAGRDDADSAEASTDASHRDDDQPRL